MAWALATNAGTIPEGILPKISTVFATLRSLAQDGTPGADLSVGLIRVIEGYALAAVIGISLGSVMGMGRLARELFLPMITALRQIPLPVLRFPTNSDDGVAIPGQLGGCPGDP